MMQKRNAITEDCRKIKHWTRFAVVFIGIH